MLAVSILESGHLIMWTLFSTLLGGSRSVPTVCGKGCKIRTFGVGKNAKSSQNARNTRKKNAWVDFYVSQAISFVRRFDVVARLRRTRVLPAPLLKPRLYRRYLEWRSLEMSSDIGDPHSRVFSFFMDSQPPNR